MYCFVIYLFNKQSEPALMSALRECMRSGETILFRMNSFFDVLNKIISF